MLAALALLSLAAVGPVRTPHSPQAPNDSARGHSRLPGLPVSPPAAVGMSAQRLDAINRIVERGIQAGGYPGASVIVGRKGMSVLSRGFGHLTWSDASAEVSPDESIYDLASLTKVVGTTTAIMVLYDQGRISLDAPVSRYIPEFSGGDKDLVTIRLLLTHRSGLPPGRDIWKITHDPVEARQIILGTPLGFHPGEYYEYSDLGADVLGYVVEAVSGQSLDEFLADYVFHPLGMYDTEFRPADSLKYRIAPTEISPPRGYPAWGEVHDENAFAMGGVAGHAGLFSTAADLSVFAQMMLNGGVYNGVRIVAESTVTYFTTREAGHRALGWDTPTGSYGSGEYLSPYAYGHTGFTGTSMWIDPARDLFVILLTNRVYDARVRHPVRVIADVRSDLSDAASLAVMDMPVGEDAMPAAFRADRERGWNEAVRHPARGRGRHAKTLSSKHGHHTGKRAPAASSEHHSKSKHTSSKPKHRSNSA